MVVVRLPGAAGRLLTIVFGRLQTTDSLPANELRELKVVPIAPLFARTVRTAHKNNGSVIPSSVRISANQGSNEP